MNLKNNMVGWFEIPVSDMTRAISFYETVFGITLNAQKMGPTDMAWFPWDETLPGAPGSLVYYPSDYKPSSDGVLIYFSSLVDDLSVELGKVSSAGGTVLLEKRLIAEEIGYMGLFIDTEGNRIALHSRK